MSNTQKIARAPELPSTYNAYLCPDLCCGGSKEISKASLHDGYSEPVRPCIASHFRDAMTAEQIVIEAPVPHWQQAWTAHTHSYLVCTLNNVPAPRRSCAEPPALHRSAASTFATHSLEKRCQRPVHRRVAHSPRRELRHRTP